MSTAAIYDKREAYAEWLYRLLPGVYRGRDSEGELRKFLDLYADELLRIRANLDRQLADHFIDSCQDWVIPYIADLVGTNLLYADARRNRVDVKNTLRWRRMKGTLAGSEDVAAGISGWGAHAAEMLERVVWVQNFAHLKPRAHFALDLRNRDAVAALNTPFSEARLIHDLRPVARRGADAVGLARARNTAVHVWPILSHPLRAGTPSALSNGRYRFSTLGRDLALYAGGDKAQHCDTNSGADICKPHTDHLPLRMRDVKEHASVYLNTPLGFSICEDGIPICAATPSTGALSAPSISPASDYAVLATQRGMVAADTTLFGAAQTFRIEAVRLGALMQLINGQNAPTPYSPGLPFAAQLVLHNAHGRLALDGATPDFGYTAGVQPYTPDSGDFHHPAMLLRLTNAGAAAAFPVSEIILRSERGAALQVFLPGLAVMQANQSLYLYVSEDGSTYFARGDHAAGLPDRNPDNGAYGAYALNHLARAAEAQVRITPGHPVGPTRTRRAVIRSLCCWDKPLEPPLTAGLVAIDPERGRFMFPAGEFPQGVLSVDYRYGFTASLGAGPYDRGVLAAATITVARNANAQHSSIQAAIDAAPNAGTLPVVIEILDSARYEEALLIDNRNFPGGLILQAAALQTPVIVKPAGPGPLLRVSNSTIASFRLDGLMLSGGNAEISGAVGDIVLRYCSFVPSTVALSVTSASLNLKAESCIAGPLILNAPDGVLQLADCIVQHPTATVEQPQGQNAIAAANIAADVQRSTLFGDCVLRSAAASNALFYGTLNLAELDASCLRFSRLPKALHPTRAFRTTSATPIFLSLSYGDAGYMHLHPNSDAALRNGGEEGGEIGAFYSAGIAWRMQNLAIRLAEYTPAGIDSFAVAALPRLAFRGNLPL